VFGVAGRTLLIDRPTRRILFEPTSNSTPNGDVPFDAALLGDDRGTFTYSDAGDRRVAAFVSFVNPDWTLVVSASLDEFAGPFVRLRLLDLAVLFAVVLAVSIGFFLLLRRATASLDRMTIAADRVGRGDFNPELPSPGSDEVGRLSAAFGLMTARIREMIAQVESNRQMGVLGRFAAELSHEIRNPLTAIKINLQGLSRDAKEGRIPEDSRRAVDMALREISRLDLAVKTALKTGKPPAEPRPFRVHEVLAASVDLVRPQAAEHGVTLHTALDAALDRHAGDAEAIRGAVLNLLLNAIEAMPTGGNVWVTTTALNDGAAPRLEIRIRDDGPGIPAELRDRVFRPFFTTKAEGTGLGLSVALQTIRAHGGSLTLGESGGPGTEIVIFLPVHATPQPA
jgi:signal transduction histidine kinase